MPVLRAGNILKVNILEELGGLLLNVEKPARYAGGEAGILSKKDGEAALRTLIAFPDLYEIGMGNQALRIIYNRMNSMKGIVCDRAFAPASDFEKLLREKNIPLYGLDTGISLASCDLLMFTLGYELGLNGILTMLDISRIPLRCEERNKNEPHNEEYPIVIAGGPAVSNPLPYSLFIDAFWIGEAEAGFFDLAEELVRLKESGKGRAALLEKISCHPNIWVRGKEKAVRAIAAGFCGDAAVFPIPSMKIIQHHGTVEIMRGCPNGCRFCHAGFWYRPMRQKSPQMIADAVREMVTKGGWHEISLSSLSSGDYCGIGELVETLNQMFADMHVSFQLPSLKVSTFSLSLLEKISATRKSGLTFAVETPEVDGQCQWQAAINKEVTFDSITAILEEAKKKGWRQAKFYFMIGLPLSSLQTREEEEIVNFIINIGRKTRMRFNINVGIFVPKPHTPYQRACQIDSVSAQEKLDFIRSKLKPLGHKVSVSDTLISRIEGLLSRGDERAGLLCEEAYLGGSRLDAWTEYIDREKWQQLLEDNNEMIEGFLSGKEPFPWQGIDSCVTDGYMREELEKSGKAKRTSSCMEKCASCGVCNKNIKTQSAAAPSGVFFAGSGVGNAAGNDLNHAVNYNNFKVNENSLQRKRDPQIYRVLFSFSKQESAVFHGHLSLIEIFSMAFTRAALPVLYTQGFNPLAKMEFASPLTTGISAGGEAASVDFASRIETDIFIQSLNSNLPDGIRIENAGGFIIPPGIKKHSLSSLLWGFAYQNASGGIDYVKACEEKAYRQARLEKDCPSLFSLKRAEVLALDKKNGTNERASYFDVYKFLYPL